MKRILCAMAVLAALLSLSGCGESEAETTISASAETSVQSVSAEAEPSQSAEVSAVEEQSAEAALESTAEEVASDMEDTPENAGMDAYLDNITTSLESTFGDNCDVVAYDNLVFVATWVDGIAAGVDAASAGDADWSTFCNSVLSCGESFYSMMDTYGVSGVSVAVNVIDDVTGDRVLLAVCDGAIVYDPVNGVDERSEQLCVASEKYCFENAINIAEGTEQDAVADDEAFDEFKAALEPTLTQNYGENYQIYKEESLIVVSVWQDGVALNAGFARGGAQENIDSWDSLCASMENFSAALCAMLPQYGLDGYSCAACVLNDLDTDNILLMTVDGETVLDVVNEIDTYGTMD